MKDYYQYRNRGYKLPEEIYKKTVKTIEAYEFYQSVANVQLATSGSIEKIVANRATAQMYIKAIDEALEKWVAEEYREVVKLKFINKIDYLTLEYMFEFKKETIKYWGQVFVYGVATLLGENYDQ